MENKDNSNLTSWLNEFYKKTDCLSFFYNQLTFKIANDLKEYQSNFNFILQELSFFLSVASNINCKELSNFKTKYQLYEFDKIDKMVSLFYERIDTSGCLKKQYDKLKENNFIKFINYKEWVNNNLYDDLKSSTTTQNGITVFLTSTVVDALQIVHEMAHYLFKHDNAQIDYLFTEGIACLNTLAFCNVMDDYLKNEDICTYFNQELEAIFEKSIDVESIGTYVDIYLKHHKINEKSIEDYCLEFGIEDQTDYLKDEAVDIKGSIDLETLFFNLRYIYSYPLVVSYFKNQDDINLLEVINNYLETNSLNEAALVFEKNYPIKSNDELENMVDDFYTYYTNEEKNKQK